ncbi:MAG: hypothetical protein ACE365_03565 [Gammaproteobacteria bacterium]
MISNPYTKEDYSQEQTSWPVLSWLELNVINKIPDNVKKVSIFVAIMIGQITNKVFLASLLPQTLKLIFSGDQTDDEESSAYHTAALIIAIFSALAKLNNTFYSRWESLTEYYDHHSQADRFVFKYVTQYLTKVSQNSASQPDEDAVVHLYCDELDGLSEYDKEKVIQDLGKILSKKIIINTDDGDSFDQEAKEGIEPGAVIIQKSLRGAYLEDTIPDFAKMAFNFDAYGLLLSNFAYGMSFSSFAFGVDTYSPWAWLSGVVGSLLAICYANSYTIYRRDSVLGMYRIWQLIDRLDETGVVNSVAWKREKIIARLGGFVAACLLFFSAYHAFALLLDEAIDDKLVGWELFLGLFSIFFSLINYMTIVHNYMSSRLNCVINNDNQNEMTFGRTVFSCLSPSRGNDENARNSDGSFSKLCRALSDREKLSLFGTGLAAVSFGLSLSNFGFEVGFDAISVYFVFYKGFWGHFASETSDYSSLLFNVFNLMLLGGCIFLGILNEQTSLRFTFERIVIPKLIQRIEKWAPKGPVEEGTYSEIRPLMSTDQEEDYVPPTSEDSCWTFFRDCVPSFSSSKNSDTLSLNGQT